MTTLFINIKELIQVRDASVHKVSGQEMSVLPTLKEAYLLVKGDSIAAFGKMNELTNITADNVIDVSGKMILPTWCDSHTHLVYAGNRSQEFVDRIKGLSYQEIANKGGGILNSAKKLQNTSEEILYKEASKRLKKLIRFGTGAIEIKSGYGLSLEAELKMLRVIKRLRATFPIPIKATFLGAHAVPELYKHNQEGYVQELIDHMIPKVAQEGLADFIDVFCETHYFSASEMDKILKAGLQHGLVPKVHVNQFTSIGGIAAAVQHKALSVDHLEILTSDDVKVLQAHPDTIPVALPTCSFFIGIPYTPSRTIIDNGLALALATDYNPGSSPSGNMNFVVATACIQMKLTPEEAINAATLNGAYAMNLHQSTGSITVGKKANFLVTTKIDTIADIPYNFGESLLERVYINGTEYT